MLKFVTFILHNKNHHREIIICKKLCVLTIPFTYPCHRNVLDRKLHEPLGCTQLDNHQIPFLMNFFATFHYNRKNPATTTRTHSRIPTPEIIQIFPLLATISNTHFVKENLNCIKNY